VSERLAELSLEGATMRPDPNENNKLYGRDISGGLMIKANSASTVRPNYRCRFQLHRV
jgi:hypothetical protein